MDWVTKRYECSLETAFRKLREIVSSDVKSACKIARPGVKFEIDKVAPNDRIVIDRKLQLTLGHAETSSVAFELMSDEILVRAINPDKPLFSAKPRLNADGECLLSVTGEAGMLQLWQVSQKALDDLFFGF